jgi:cell division protein FtsN
VLGGVSLAVREGAVGDKTYYRIKAGPLESKEAGTDLCNRLKTAGMTTLGPCLVNK